MKQQGSTALTVLAALASVSASFLYISNLKSHLKQEVDKAAARSSSAISQISDINTLSRFRSLVANRKISIGVYEPAIYPINYFETDWELSPNQTIINQIDTTKGKVQVLSDGVKFSQVSSGTSLGELTKVLEDGTSAATAASVDRTVKIHKVAFEKPNGTLATSLDVGVYEDKREVRARIPLEPPFPYNPILEIRKVGSSAWTQNFSNIERGNYEVRVLASGVVLAAKVKIGNDEERTLGFDADGNINHKAVNIRAKDEEIGRFTYAFTEDMDFDEPNCMVTPIDGNFKYEIRLVAADSTEKSGNKSGDITVKPNTPADAVHQTAEEYAKICSAQCKYEPDFQAKEAAFTVEMLRSQKFPDYSWRANYQEISTHLKEKNYKICENIAKWSQAAGITKSPFFASMSDADLNAYLWKNATVPNPGAVSVFDAQKIYLQYFGYRAPDCVRVPLFVRGQCGCFAVGTRIRLEDGSEKPIDQLNGSESVWNPVTQKGQAIRHMTRGPEKLPLFRIQSHGREVLVTGTHPFATRRGVVPAFQLEAGEEIQSVTGEWEKVDSIQMQAPSDNPPVVWNLELEGPDDDPKSHFVEANGLVTGDLLLQNQLQGKGNSR